MQDKLDQAKSLKLGRRSAARGLVATIIIVPIIMLASNLTSPDPTSDPMAREFSTMVGVLYFPVVFLISWVISYIVLREKANKKNGIEEQ